MAFIETRDGTRLFTKVWGDGPPVIMTHGWSMSADIWDEHSVALAHAGHRVVTYDRRGFGRSDQPWHGYDYDTLADDLADVMRATGVDDGATIVGYSMGSGEIARYMSRHGGRGVVRAALVSPVAPLLMRRDDNPAGFDPAKFERMTGELIADRPAFFRTYARNLYGVGVITHPVSEAVVDWTWHIMLQAGLRPLLAAREAFGWTDFRPDMAAFTVPTLIVHGTGDSDAPIDATARAAATAIPGARLIDYAGAPHGLPITHRERLVADLLDFLSGRL